MKSRNAAVAALLTDLRDELLAAPGEAQAAEHVAMMRVEEQVFAPTPRTKARMTPRRPAHRSALGARPGQLRRATSTRPRRFAAVFAAICVLSANVGLNAAGALPGAFRTITDRITDTIVDTFGVPQASDPRSAGPPARASSPATIDAVPTTDSALASEPADSAPSVTASPPAASPVIETQPLGTPEPPAPDRTEPAAPPSSSEPPDDSPRPPKNNMVKDPNAPAGLPSDWRERAVSAARTQFETCAQATDLAPAGCPQVADAGADGAESVQWIALNQPLAGATATARAVAGGGGSNSPLAVITVYGLFQMHGTYTVGDEPQPRATYSSGVAKASMTWDGSSLVNVSFASGSVADELPAGVSVPAFERPANTPDAAVLAALQSGFDAWATGGGGTVVGDPTLGAVVTFDPVTGSFTVSGGYVSAAGNTGGGGGTHQYTASLVAGGGVVHLLSITGS